MRCRFAVALAVLAMACPSPATNAQTNEWAWMGGSNTTGTQLGVYGMLGTPAAGNIPSGRFGAFGWTDKKGDFWLFGGWGSSVNPYLVDALDDLWEYSPSTGEWTWMGGTNPYMGQPGIYGTQGTPSTTNYPGSRQNAVTWTDSDGNLWLFGGEGYDSEDIYGYLNDLWKFDPSTDAWTWEAGSSTVPGNAQGVPGVYGTRLEPSVSNIPGGRMSASAWTDSTGNFWLFGGYGVDSAGNYGELNDVWEFKPSTNEWVWVTGTSTFTGPNRGPSGVYGALQTPAAANTPGGRDSSVSWTDSSGNLWLFAGEAVDAAGTFGTVNDVWEFNPSTYEWTWIGGSTLAAASPAFGTLGTPSIGNIPAGGYGDSVWIDATGNPWIFGGSTSGGFDNESGANDLWEFDVDDLEWAWMGGDQGALFAGPVYGTEGTPAPGNIPGGRYDGVNWTDKNGNLWIFGGGGYAANGNSATWNYLNDLWEYTAPSAPAPVPSYKVYASPPAISVAIGKSGTATINSVVADGFDAPVSLSASGQPAGVTVRFGSNSISGTGTAQMTISVGSTVDSGQYTITVTGTSGSATETTTVTLTVPVPPPPFTVALSTSSIYVQSGSQATVTVTLTPESGFDSPVVLSASGQWNGVAVSFNPTSITGGGSSQMTISIASSVAFSGTDNIVVTGTSGSVTESTAIGLNDTTGPPSFTLNLGVTSVLVNSGSYETLNPEITSLNGFSSAVSLACSGLPAGVTCSFSPATITPAPDTTVSPQLTITASAQSAAFRRGSASGLLAAAAAAGLFLAGWRRRSDLRCMLLVVAVCASIAFVSSCSGGSGGGGNSGPQNYAVTIEATSGSLQQSASFTLTIN
jgi:N-acetylneuraminic acid mutarotase